MVFFFIFFFYLDIQASKLKNQQRMNAETNEDGKEDKQTSNLVDVFSKPLHQHLLQIDNCVQKLYESLPDNGLMLVSMQGGTHTSKVQSYINRNNGDGELMTAADNAIVCFVVKPTVFVDK